MEKGGKKKAAGKLRIRRNTDRLAFIYVRVGYCSCRNDMKQALLSHKLICDFVILMLQETQEKEKTTIKCSLYDRQPNPRRPNKRHLTIYCV